MSAPYKAKAREVRKLREYTNCGMHDAKEALEARNGNFSLAVEYVQRKRLAAVMSDEARFPEYYKTLK